jgi:tRNA(Ile)-lysidine synthase
VTGPRPATAAVRVAVRRCLADLPGDAVVAAAVSGGADSLALAAALAFERSGSVALVVDHGLQAGSADVAARAAQQCRDLGLDAEVLELPARSSCSPHGHDRVDSKNIGGPEAAARALRYALLDDAVARRGLAAVLLGHTGDDQAETVLLGLVRGSGARALAGMPAARGAYRRPLLGLGRSTVRVACGEAGLVPHDDPHNDDDAYARVRARRLLPVLEEALGPGTTAALARSAAQLREDADALDALTPALPDEPACEQLAALPAALRARALKGWAEQRCGAAVTAAHVDALRALVEHWHGQGAVALPRGTRIARRTHRLVRVLPEQW